MRAPGQRDPARTPRDLPRGAVAAALKRTATEFLDDRLLQWAAGLTFFAMLSLFPALIALVAVLGVIGTPATEPLIENVGALAPGSARDITLGALRTVHDAGGAAGFTLVASLAVALWSASAYVGGFLPAANVVWEVEEARSLWRKLLVRLALTALLLALIALTALTVVLTGPIAEQVGAAIGLGDEAVAVWQMAKWPFLGLAVMTLVGVLYRAAPNVRHPSWRWVMPGSVVAVALWIVASVGFTLYVGTFAAYNQLYGPIGGVLVFLLWLWLTNVAVLLGAELNAELERARAIDAGMRPEDKTPYLPLRDA